MKYGGLAWALVRGIVLISLVGIVLFLVKQNYLHNHGQTDDLIFTVLAGAALGGAFGFAAKMFIREILKLDDRAQSKG